MSAMLPLPMVMVLKCRGSGQLRPCFFLCGGKKRRTKWLLRKFRGLRASHLSDKTDHRVFGEIKAGQRAGETPIVWT